MSDRYAPETGKKIMRMKSGQPTSRRPQRNVVFTWLLGKLDGFVWFSAAAAVAAAACDDRVKGNVSC